MPYYHINNSDQDTRLYFHKKQHQQCSQICKSQHHGGYCDYVSVKIQLVITTLPEITAEDLLKHQKIWQHVLDFTKVKKNKKWYKVVAHRISTAIFNIPNGMQLAKEEIETFNKDLKLACLPTWLTSEEI